MASQLPLAVTQPCTGEAHQNPYIDHCPVCMPNWGFTIHCINCGKQLKYSRRGVLQLACEKCGTRHGQTDYRNLFRQQAYDAQLAAIAASDDTPWATRTEVEKWTDDIAKWSNTGMRSAVIDALVEAVNNTIEQCANLAQAEGQDKLAGFMREGLIK